GAHAEDPGADGQVGFARILVTVVVEVPEVSVCRIDLQAHRRAKPEIQGRTAVHGVEGRGCVVSEGQSNVDRNAAPAGAQGAGEYLDRAVRGQVDSEQSQGRVGRDPETRGAEANVARAVELEAVGGAALDLK